MRLRWLIAACVLALILAILQFWAVADFLYWRYEWFDIVMHALGGVTIGTLLIALSMKFRPLVFIVGLAAVFIGWEIFEYVFGLPREANYMFDTALDFLMDTLGALVAYIVARLTSWRSV